MGVHLNQALLFPIVGRSLLHPSLGHVDVLEQILEQLLDKWKAGCFCTAAHRFCSHMNLSFSGAPIPEFEEGCPSHQKIGELPSASLAQKMAVGCLSIVELRVPAIGFRYHLNEKGG